MRAYCAASREQLVVRAVLDDAAVVDHDDAVGEPGGLQPVRDEDRRAALRGDAHRGLHLGLGLEVEVRRRFVEQQDRGVDEMGARERDELALAGRQRAAPFAHPLEVAAGQRRDEVVRADLARRGFDLGVGRVLAAVGDVVADRAREQERLLRHDTELLVERDLVVRGSPARRRPRRCPTSGRRSGRRASSPSTCPRRSRRRARPSRPGRCCRSTPRSASSIALE